MTMLSASSSIATSSPGGRRGVAAPLLRLLACCAGGLPLGAAASSRGGRRLDGGDHSYESAAAVSGAASFDPDPSRLHSPSRDFGGVVAATGDVEVATGGGDDDDAKRLDCLMRRLFLERAARAVPWRENNFADVADALELEARCSGITDHDESNPGVGVDAVPPPVPSAERLERMNGGGSGAGERNGDVAHRYYVCPAGRDDDGGDGTRERPFRTIGRALRASRESVSDLLVASTGAADAETIPRRTILLCGGVHYLDETIELTPDDSYLTITSDPDNVNEEKAWISGGIFVQASTAGWTPSAPGSPILVADLSPLIGSDDDDEGRNTIAAGLFAVEPHRRMTLARYPNADVEVWDSPDRYLNSDSVSEWLFPPRHGPPVMYTVDLSAPNNPTGHIKDDSAMEDYNKFGTGQGGACASVWGDRPSYWCGEVSAGGWAEVDRKAAASGRMNIPAGVTLTGEVSERAKTWNAEGAKGAVVHASHTQGWAWHMFAVSSVHVDPKSNATTTLHFEKGGGSQGGRNWQCHNEDGRLSDCDGPGKTLSGGGWYVEGVREELDTEGEFYYDAEKKILYFYPPASSDSTLASAEAVAEAEDVASTERLELSEQVQQRRLGADPPQAKVPDLIATKLQTLIKIQGTKDTPVRGIDLLNLGFRDAAKTYMEQWSAPSGGDWALHRGGAVHVEGAEDVTISDCNFQRLDGNAIMLSGYTRRTHITDSEFAWLGNGAVATWGDTKDDGYDATEGEQPRLSLLEGCVMSNLGLYQKQSSGWGQNKAAENTIRNNVMFNLPRAAVNFNDGLGGNNTVEGNVIFSACRESGDHGPINSWDRMPFLASTTASPVPSFQPAPTHTTKNLILANYGASQGFDNDDGSSYYYTHDNVFYAADGFKMDYGGHDSIFNDNLVYGDECFGTGRFLQGHSDRFHDNTCIIAAGGRGADKKHNVGNLFQCSKDGLLLYNNSYYTVDGNVTWTCPGVGTYNLSEVRGMGMEAGTVTGATPRAEIIVTWARGILGQLV